MMLMSREWACAAAAGLLVLAGCNGMPHPSWLTGEVKVPSGVSFAALAANGQFTYAISVQETSVSLQELLRRLGLSVLNVQVDDATGVVRIKSFTPDKENQEFTLVLHPENGGAKTRVTLEWEKAGAANNSLKILLELEKIKRAPTPGA
jgi:hypothetical protein